MTTTDGIPIRADIEFDDFLNKLLAERVVRGVDRNLNSKRRMTKAVARLANKSVDFRESLIISPLEDDRKFRRFNNKIKRIIK